MSTRGHLALCLARDLAPIYSAREGTRFVRDRLILFALRRVARSDGVYRRTDSRLYLNLVDEKKRDRVAQNHFSGSAGALSTDAVVDAPFGLRLSGFSGLARKPYALPEYAQANVELSRVFVATVHGTTRSLAHSIRSGCNNSRCSASVRLTNDDKRRRQERSHKSSYWRRCIRWMMSRQSLNTLLMFSVSTAHVKCG